MEIGVENNWKLKVGIFSEKCKYPASHCLWMGAHPNAYRLVYIICILDLWPDIQLLFLGGL